MSLDVLERPDVVDPDMELGDPIVAHYVGPDFDVTEARVMGTPVVALCGHIFVPHRNPDRLPVCQRCQEIYDTHPTDERGEAKIR